MDYKHFLIALSLGIAFTAPDVIQPFIKNEVKVASTLYITKKEEPIIEPHTHKEEGRPFQEYEVKSVYQTSVAGIIYK